MEVGIFMMCTVVQGITLQMLAKKIFQKKPNVLFFTLSFQVKSLIIVACASASILSYYFIFVFSDSTNL